MIIPFRPGHFGVPARRGDWRDTTRSFVEDMAAFLRLFNLMDAPLLGHSTGAIFAMELAREAPNPDRKLILSSPQYFAGASAHRHGFNHTWASICSKYPQLVGPIINHTIGTFAHPDFFVSVLRNTYKDIPHDLEIIERYRARSWFLELLRIISKTSAVGLSVDFCVSGTDWLEKFRSNLGRVHVVYGQQDVFASHEITHARLAACDADVTIRPGVGQDGNAADALFVLDLLQKSPAELPTTP